MPTHTRALCGSYVGTHRQPHKEWRMVVELDVRTSPRTNGGRSIMNAVRYLLNLVRTVPIDL